MKSDNIWSKKMQEFTVKKIERAVTLEAVVAAFDVIRPKNFYFAGEMHDFWEMVYAADGVATATADERVYTLTRGNLLFHKPMEFHRVWYSANTAPHLLLISFKAAGIAMRQLEKGFYRLNGYQAARLAEIEKLFEQIIGLYETGRNGNEFKLKSSLAAAAFEGFITELCESGLEDRRDNSPYADTYRRVIRYMQSHCCESLTVCQIARACGLSESNLKRIFKMFCDRGVISYHNSLRIRTAVKMLYDEIPVSKISEELGFSSPSYFYVAFKRETGKTPRDFLKSK